ncbi:MAG: hypothetical protein ACK574_11890 [Bacteroidota bacterium]
MHTYRYFLGLSCLLGLSACEVLEDTTPVTVPSDIHIPSVSTSTNSDGSQGDAFHRIPDVWVYDEGVLLGIYRIPATIPIPRSGKVNLNIEAGVVYSGQLEERIPYPMFQTYRITKDLKENTVDTVKPEFTYRSSCVFPLIEDFDKVGFRFTLNPLYSRAGDTVLRVSGTQALEAGKNSGKVELTPGTQSFQLFTTENFNLPGMNQPVFLEMDYKSNVPLILGYYYFEPGQSSSQPNEVIRLFNTEGEWRKVYLALNQETAGKPSNTLYKFYIGLFKDANQQADIYLDNIKIVY